MKIDKEYPATHSMSTSWYIVDDEGNVGIMDYNDNGPVPFGVEENDISDLVWGVSLDDNEVEHIPIKLTKEQIYENLPSPHSPKDEKLWFCCVVKIRPEQTVRFKEICNHELIERCACISEEEGLYLFDSIGCVDLDNDRSVIKGTPLDMLLTENIIVEVYYYNFYNDDHYNKETQEIEHSKNYDSCSYFVYHQPYSIDCFPEKMSTPKNPVKLSQMPDDIKAKIHHVSGNFYDLKTFQIAEHCPCDMTYCRDDNEVLIDGCEYNLLPLPDGTEAYLLSEKSDTHKIKYTVEEFEVLKQLGRVKKPQKC